jgi:WD40 repeat protein
MYHTWNLLSFVLLIDQVKWKSSVFQAKMSTGVSKSDWNNKNQFLVGCSNGFVAVWDVTPYLQGKKILKENAFAGPDYYYEHHHAPIVNVVWYRDEYILASALNGKVSGCHLLEPDMKQEILSSNSICCLISVGHLSPGV